MKRRIFLLALLANIIVSGLFAASVTRYVSLTGSNTSPYTSMATAAHEIGLAVNISNNGDIILVDAGTYLLSTNIVITKGITVSSINGSDVTIIDGNNAVRCVFIDHPNAVLEGFTIQNGKNLSGYGGGVDIDKNGTVRNCIIRNNQARDGGGVALDKGGFAENCVIYGNTARYGGGVRLHSGGEVRNCLIKGNTTTYIGGGVNIWNSGKVKNCVITENNGPNGAGIRIRNNGKVYNCIIYYNNGDNYEVNGSGNHFYNTCTTPALPGSYSTDCITSVPQFISLTSGSEDYRLQSTSTCIDAGKNFNWMSTVPDLDGNTRIVNGIVDMGAYEYFLPTPTDSDGDGVADVDDEYPTDPDRAYNNYYPPGGFGTLAYEDLWPGRGDYDFNDLIVDYKFKTVTSGSNHIVETFGSFVVRAHGAYYQNGFGFQLANNNVASADILSVTGNDLQEGYINLAANGIEAGQAIPTIIVYDNAYNILPHPGNSIGVNTEIAATFVEPDTLNIYIDFRDGVYSLLDLGIAAFNPFIIINKVRGNEVHLPGYTPTSLVDESVFSTLDDDTNPAIGKYYKTIINLPWAINIPEGFDYPIEKRDITSVYLKFAEWAESGGQLSQDWYLDEPGYRNSSLIYNHD